MRKIIAIFVNDIRRICKRPAAIVILLGLLVIPGIYAWLNIDSNWNPYDNTGNLPIAIVNKDKGTVILEKDLNMGNSLVESLKKNNAMKWVFTSEADAKEKVYKSEYYGEIVIPNDFSKKLVAVFDSGEIKRPELDFYVNQKKNPIAPIIVNKAVSTIQNTINQNIVNALIYKALNTADNIKLVAKAAKSTDNIIEKLKEGREGISDLRAIFKILEVSAESTNHSLSAFRDLLPTVDSLTGTTKEGISNIQGAMDSFKDLSDDIDNVIASLEREGSEISKMVDDINLGPQKENAAIISGKVDEIDGKLTEKKNRIKRVQELLSSIGEHYQLKALGGLQGRLDKVVTEIDNTQTVIANNHQTKKDLQNIGQHLKGIQVQEKGLYKGYRKDIKNDMDSAYSSSSKSLDSISDLLTGLNEVAQKTDSALASMMKAIGNTKDLTNNLDHVSSKLQKDIDRIIDNLSGSKKSELYDKFVNLMENDPVEVAEFLSNPVKTNEIDIYGKDLAGEKLSYGTKMAPFYTVLACWVGCTILISIIKTEITDMEGIEKFRNYQKFLGRFMIFAIMAMCQGLIIGVGDIILKVQVIHRVLFVLTIMISSFVFMLFVYSMTVSFGKVGEALSIVVMVLQVAGSGGTFPIEMLPRAFEILQPIMPFYPAMNVLRETIGGFYANNFTIYMLMLLSHMIIPLLLGLIFRTPLIHLKEKIDRELEKTDMIV
ncbi:hypothetical protein H8356DRAFT_1661304 [Neocallimastix lanati (nom. inval.)]|uniref:ABC-2 type transporter transmembrane domain-containing protein n=1 Tax=Neocallimastix californiae TaxID=1754190 RepID=A0A1Y2ADI9_9FUNG|nr:hypothetical protein H8356DRAFT_1661304 [Neocallimastix sp. JGI-2020a]ORY20582.1 hypothetical protein LY90DRAFT_707787 [Neocallimastix californiae]|eukprot:ORY20582.1 hypothetical protein LY90DRAFT_707787 [Neocallimastix californiae]